MKLHFAFLSILLAFVFNHSVFAQGNKNFCGHEQDQMQYWKENPAAFEDFQELLKNARNLESAKGIKRNKFIIPVVFHVIHNDGSENVDDDLIIKQMEVLNKDFKLFKYPKYFHSIYSFFLFFLNMLFFYILLIYRGFLLLVFLILLLPEL